MKVGIKQISQLSGFSQATVSNVLNNKKGVNRETSEKIWKIAKELGYYQQSLIKTIKFVIFKKHGEVVSDTPFFGALINGVEGGCKLLGYKLEIINIDCKAPSFSSVLEGLFSDRSSAILLLATEMEKSDILPFENSPVPVVVLDNWFSNMTFNSTLINNSDSSCNSVEYLIQNGHTKIGHLKSSIEINNFKYREYGFNRAMLKAGLALGPEYTFLLRPTTDGSYLDMTNCLKKNPQMPTAFIADNDIIALGAMKAIQEAGYSIPEDISVIGFDDIPFCEFFSPSLTTVKVFKENMGEEAVRMLHMLIQNNGRAHGAALKLEVSTEFMVRNSVKKLN